MLAITWALPTPIIAEEISGCWSPRRSGPWPTGRPSPRTAERVAGGHPAHRARPAQPHPGADAPCAAEDSRDVVCLGLPSRRRLRVGRQPLPRRDRRPVRKGSRGPVHARTDGPPAGGQRHAVQQREQVPRRRWAVVDGDETALEVRVGRPDGDQGFRAASRDGSRSATPSRTTHDHRAPCDHRCSHRGQPHQPRLRQPHRKWNGRRPPLAGRERLLPVDTASIPLGWAEPVQDSPFDFRAGAALPRASPHPQVRRARRHRPRLGGCR